MVFGRGEVSDGVGNDDNVKEVMRRGSENDGNGDAGSDCCEKREVEIMCLKRYR